MHEGASNYREGMSSETSEERAHKKQRVTEENAGEGEKCFLKGAITKICLRNFMTYEDYVEVSPGAGLNVIVGPNGSGKSSIVSAICLGLGGMPKLTGRGSDAKSYIKDGHDTAEIELTLFLSANQSVVISRQISRESGTSWGLNRKSCSQKKVLELIRALNIQVDNLCQFLAQERVSKFTGLDPQALLRETEKAIGDSGLYRDHLQLIEVGKERFKMQAEVKRLETEISSHNAQLERWAEDVERIEKRDLHIQEKEVLQGKLYWVEAHQYEAEVAGKKALVEEIKAEYRVLEEELNPFLQEIEGVKDDIGEVEGNSQLLQKQHEKAEKDCGKSQQVIRDNNDKLDDLNREMERERKERSKRAHDIEKYRAAIAKGEEELTKFPSAEQLKEERAELISKRTDLFTANNACGKKADDCEKSIKNLIAEKQRQTKNLAELGKLKRDRFVALKTRYGSVLQSAYDFVNNAENQKSFRGKIWGPVALYVELLDAKAEKIIESAIPRNWQTAFVVEHTQDGNLFHSKFPSLKWISVPEQSIHPTFDPKQIHPSLQLVSELISAPLPIQKALFAHLKLHQRVFTFNMKLDPDSVMKRSHNDKNGLLNLFTLNSRYSVGFSAYGNREKSTSVSSLQSSTIFRIRMSSKNVAETKAKIQQLETAIEEVEKTQEEASKAGAEVCAKLDEIKAEVRRLDTVEQNMERTNSKVEHYRKKLKDLTSVPQESLQEVAAEIKASKKRLFRNQLKAITKHTKNLEELAHTIFSQDSVIIHLAHLKCRLDQLQSSQTMRSQQINHKKRQVKAVKDELQLAKQRMNEKMRFAESKAPLEQYQKLFEQFKVSDDLVVIQHRIMELQGKIEALLPDMQILERFAEVKHTKELLEGERQRVLDSIERLGQESFDLRNRWQTSLEQQVHQISASIGKLFQTMGCQACARLAVDEDYAKYGLEIMVKFRENSELQVLKSSTHSGGERSVSTMLYLLALQSVSCVPFRVVDEINQGMDPRNERMIFQRIVEQADGRESPQYFLVTPKLLPNLNYADCKSISIHFVYNGFYMPPDPLEFPKFFG